MKAINIKNKQAGRYLRGVDLGRINQLLPTMATPFLLLNTDMIRDNLRRLRGALPGVEVYYAVKANNHPDIIRTLCEDRCRFDISSAKELQMIVAAGGRAEETIHTNPIKSGPEFDAAVAGGTPIFVADNIAELDKFVRFGGRAGVMLRFKTTQGGSVVNLSYKFGADVADIPAMLDRVLELGIPFRGFCFHVGSQCTTSEKYINAIATAKSLIELAAGKGMTTEILDIGGGFPIEYTEDVPSIESIGATIMEALQKQIDPAVRIICEPGRFISGEAVTLFASVIGKAVRDGVKWYYLDDGLYGSFSGRLYDQCRYRILTNRNTKWEKAVLAGPTCDSFDVIYNDCILPPLDLGDVLMFPGMGAYCAVSATEFNGLGQVRTVLAQDGLPVPEVVRQ
jgi:ornithine decarboxylase